MAKMTDTDKAQIKALMDKSYDELAKQLQEASSAASKALRTKQLVAIALGRKSRRMAD